jgi:hypothetical protein
MFNLKDQILIHGQTFNLEMQNLEKGDEKRGCKSDSEKIETKNLKKEFYDEFSLSHLTSFHNISKIVSV